MPLQVRVFRFPTGRKFIFLVFNYRGSGKTVVHSGKVNKWFESGTWLAHCKHSTVEFILAASADHGFDITVSRVYGY